MPKKFRKFNRPGIAKRVRKLESKLKPEKKFTYTLYTAQSISNAGVDTQLTGVATGTSQNDRIGNSIRVTGIYADLFFTGADLTNSMRCIVYIPRNPTDNLSVGPLQFNQGPDLDSYVVLKDMLITTSQAGPDVARRKIRLKFDRGLSKGIHVQYNGTGGGNLIKNPVRIYFVSDSGAIAHPELNGYIYMYYTDM